MAGIRLSTAEAIVIKRKNIGEADRLITMLTKQYGKLRVTAKGVRKISSRRGPHIEIFNRVTVSLHDKKTITEVTTVDTYQALRGDLTRVSAAYYLCELIDGLLPIEQPHEDVYALFADALGALSTVKRERVGVLRERFAAALLTKLGFLVKGKKHANLDGYIEGLMERRLKTTRVRFN